MKKPLACPVQLALALALCASPWVGRAEAGGLRHGHWHGRPVYVVSPSQSLQLNQETLTFSLLGHPTTDALQLVSGGQTFQLVVGNQPTSSDALRVGGTSGSEMTLSLAPSDTGTPTLTGTDDVDTAYQVMTLGFGNDRSKVEDLERTIGDRFRGLVNAVGTVLNDREIRALVVETGREFLRRNSFGFLIDEALDPFLDKIVDNVIADRRSQATPDEPGGTPVTPAAAPMPAINASGNGLIFDVTGYIAITPRSGTAPPSPSPETAPPAPSPGTAPPAPSPGTAPSQPPQPATIEPGVIVAPDIP